MNNIVKLLPIKDDIKYKIDEYICKRRSNNKISNNIIIRINTTKTASNCEKEVISWVLKCLSHPKFDNIIDKNGNFLWRIVVGTYNNLIIKDSNKLKNQLIFAIHLEEKNSIMLNISDEIMDDDQLVTFKENTLYEEYINIKTVSATDILNTLVFEPQYVTGIGVSGVNDDYIAKTWGLIVNRCYSPTGLGGKGIFQHEMWKRFSNVIGWTSIRETSYKFGWKYYPSVHD